MWPEARPGRGSGILAGEARGRRGHRRSRGCRRRAGRGRPPCRPPPRRSSEAVKWPWRCGSRAALERAAFRLPFLQAAVEHGDIMGAEALQHPPGPRRAVQRAVVVDDEAVAVAERRATASGWRTCARAAACAGAGCRESETSSRSRRPRPEYAPASYSARASRPVPGRKAVASITLQVGRAELGSSHSVETSESTPSPVPWKTRPGRTGSATIIICPERRRRRSAGSGR